MEQRIEIVLHGHLPPVWTDTFSGMQISCLPDGTCRITGTVRDQAAIYGLLNQLRDFGLPLVSVQTQDVKELK